MRYIIACVVMLSHIGCAQQNIEFSRVDESKSIVDERGKQVTITKRILLKLHKGYDIKLYEKKYGLRVQKQLKKDVYVVEVDDIEQVIPLARLLRKEAGVLYAHPDYVKHYYQR